MSADRYAQRRNKLVRLMRQSGVDTLLVTNFRNVTYLTGFRGDDSYLLVSKGHTILLSDGRYTTQIADECPGLEAEIRSQSESLTKVVARLVGKMGVSQLGIEADSMTVAGWNTLSSAAKSLTLVPVASLVEQLRVVKDAGEIREIREAVTQAERGFDLLKASLTAEMTELQAAHELEHGMRRFGAVESSFDPIVAVGSQAALPHARPGNRRMSEAPFVLIDWGATNPGGYRSDLTRVLGTGKISSKLESLYGVVLKAQLQGIAAVHPGARCCDVDRAARQVIEEAGYGKQFNHGLGHGIGLDIHEGPRLNSATETELQPGMVVTVEPGVYLPGWGGIRIEDDVLVTKDGCEVLTSVPKDLQSLNSC